MNPPPVSDKPKMIIGVPVLPMPGAGSRASICSTSEMQGALLQEGLAEVEGAASINEPQWKLRHQDFIARQMKSKKDEAFETFTLVYNYFWYLSNTSLN